LLLKLVREHAPIVNIAELAFVYVSVAEAIVEFVVVLAVLCSSITI